MCYSLCVCLAQEALQLRYMRAVLFSLPYITQQPSAWMWMLNLCVFFFFSCLAVIVWDCCRCYFPVNQLNTLTSFTSLLGFSSMTAYISSEHRLFTKSLTFERLFVYSNVQKPAVLKHNCWVGFNKRKRGRALQWRLSLARRTGFKADISKVLIPCLWSMEFINTACSFHEFFSTFCWSSLALCTAPILALH